MGLTILGTGRHLPKDIARNEDLARVMDTDAEWIREKSNVRLEDIDLFVAHQANDRINQAVRDALKAATIPILLDELNEAGRLRPGSLVCFLALGAGLHWGAALMRL